MEYRYLNLEETKVENRTISGVAVPYNSSSHVLTDRARPYREQFRSGSFQHIGENVALYVQHDHRGLPLARTGSGTLRFTESDKGLLFEADLPESRPDIIEAVRRGDIAGVSIGFTPLKDSWKHRGGSLPSNRTITSAHLYELSLVASPAYPNATISQ